MKKVLLIILISFLGRDLIGQAITKRAGASVTVNDENLFVGKSFRVPVYTDTTAANLAVTLDSAGKLIFTYDINGLWLRESNPKKWVEVGSGGGGGGSGTVTSISQDYGILTTPNPITTTGSVKLDSATVYGKVRNIVSDTATVLRQALTDTASTRVIINRSVPAGQVFSDNFARSSLGSNYTSSGGTYSFPSSTYLQMTGGTGSFTNYIIRNQAISTHQHIDSVRFVPTVKNGTSYGVAIGVKSLFSSRDLIAQFSVATSTIVGNIIIYGGENYPVAVLAQSATLPFSTGDSLLGILKRVDTLVTATYKNLTTGDSVTISYGFSTASTSGYLLHNTGNPVLYNIGGTNNVSYLSFNNLQVKNNDAYIGNSLTTGYNATKFNNTYLQKTYNYRTDYSVVGGASDRTAEILRDLPEYGSYLPLKTFVDIGVNDLLGGVSAATFSSNYDSICHYIKNTGSKGYLMAISPTTSSVVAFNDTIQAKAIKYGFTYLDLYSLLKSPSGTTLNSIYNSGDNLHWNDLGNAVVANFLQPYRNVYSNNVKVNDGSNELFYSDGGVVIAKTDSIIQGQKLRAQISSGVYSEIETLPLVGRIDLPRAMLHVYGGGVLNSGLIVTNGNATGSTQTPSFLGISTNKDPIQDSSKQAYLYLKSNAFKITTYKGSVTPNTVDIHFGGDIESTADSKMIIKTDGKVGIGTTAPTAILHIATAGTAAAGTAPIKLNSGTALTTPEDGAIEYHGSHIYFTIGSTRYQLDQQAGTNLGNSNLTQSSGLREYTLGYFNASGDRYLSFGKANYTENANILINANSTNHNGFIQSFAKDSINGLQISETISPNANRKYTTLNQSSLTTTISNYMDSTIIAYTGATKLRYNLGKDTFSIKGNMPISASSSDSVFVRDNNDVVKVIAQSDLGGGLLSGTYTPTLTNVANVAASTAYSCQYSRVGTVVTVSGEVDIDPTTTLTLTQLGISLPIASNLTATNELGGTSADDLNTAARVAGDATNNRAEIRMTPVDVTNRRFSFTFTYRVL